GYGTLFRYRVAPDYWFAKELLERQGLEGDHHALEQSIRDAWDRVKPQGVATSDASGRPAVAQADMDAELDGPVPAWRSAWEMWRHQYEIALTKHGLHGDPADAADYLRDFLGDLDAYPDARATLDQLSANGLVLGVLSNADEDFLQRSLSRAR